MVLCVGVIFVSLVSLQGVILEGGVTSLSIRWFMVLLRSWLTMLIIRANYKPQNNKIFLVLLGLRLFILAYCFTAKRVLSFYIFLHYACLVAFVNWLASGYIRYFHRTIGCNKD